jgi:hypothetical protein
MPICPIIGWSAAKSAAPRDNGSSPIWISRERIAASVLELVTLGAHFPSP